MKKEIIKTSDGSPTIHIPEWNESYHSVHGAIQESYHVFIKNGLDQTQKPEIDILELGFGTGLNALITYKEAHKKKLKVNYTGLEAYPVDIEVISKLDYPQRLEYPKLESVFKRMHQIEWEGEMEIDAGFRLYKKVKDFKEIDSVSSYDLVYYDAFGPRVQPELWTDEMFEKVFRSMRSSGILVTYCAKGSVRRSMQKVGFEVQRLEGPPGKREMLRAAKPDN